MTASFENIRRLEAGQDGGGPGTSQKSNHHDKCGEEEERRPAKDKADTQRFPHQGVERWKEQLGLRHGQRRGENA